VRSLVAEPRFVNKPRSARPLADLVGPALTAAFKRQGFASAEIVTHWEDIVGPEIAAHCEPIRINWPRKRDLGDAEEPEPATLVLRCQGPAAIEIQHLAGVIVERVNRFLGWRAIDRIALRQAPLARRAKPRPPPAIDAAEARRIAARMTDIADDNLRAALGRLGAAVKRGSGE
jgi:hypothetical protein